MSRIVKYRPDYSMIYPNEVISDELLSFLKKSDARMEYEDVHRKRERIRKGEDGKEIVLPCLEHSVEVLIEAGHQFAASTPSPEHMPQPTQDKLLTKAARAAAATFKKINFAPIPNSIGNVIPIQLGNVTSLYKALRRISTPSML